MIALVNPMLRAMNNKSAVEFERTINLFVSLKPTAIKHNSKFIIIPNQILIIISNLISISNVISF